MCVFLSFSLSLSWTSFPCGSTSSLILGALENMDSWILLISVIGKWTSKNGWARQRVHQLANMWNGGGSQSRLGRDIPSSAVTTSTWFPTSFSSPVRIHRLQVRSYLPRQFFMVMTPQAHFTSLDSLGWLQQLLMQKYDPDTIMPKLKPMCLSTNGKKHKLIPSENEGW